MKRVFFGVVVFFFFVAATWGQGADDYTIEDVEFNCDDIISLTARHGQEDLLRVGETIKSVFDYFAALMREGCTMPSVLPKKDEDPVWIAGVEDRIEWNCAAIRMMSMELLTVKVARIGSRKLTLVDYFVERVPACIDAQEVADAVATRVYVPDWARDSSGRYEINCETARAIADTFMFREFLRDGSDVQTFRDVYWRIVNECFNVYGGNDDDPQKGTTYVTVTRSTYLRDCAGITCAAIGRAPEATVWRVLGEYKGWYLVPYRDGSAYIATWLTVRDSDWLWDQSDFHAIVTASTELRVCPGRSCDVVGEVAAGSVFEVVDSANGWHELVVDGDTVFVDSQFTEPGPTIILDTGYPKQFASIGCIVVPFVFGSRSKMAFHVSITGPRRADVRVDIYSPVDRFNLLLVDPAHKRFEDDGENFLLQTYDTSTDFGVGMNILEIEFDGVIERVGINARFAGLHRPSVIC